MSSPQQLVAKFSKSIQPQSIHIKDPSTQKQNSGAQRRGSEHDMMRNEDYSIGAAEPWLWMDPLQDRKRKRRFNEDQIRSLESMFESQTRLDPRKKQQLAGELGLHPRQVAIWFQNKRARGKSKQLESEYGALKEDYDALLSSVELLEKEKQILTKQLQMLTELLEEPLERRKYGDSNKEAKENHRLSLSMAETSGLTPTVHSVGNKISNISEQEPEPFMGHSVSDFSTSVEQQFCFQPSLPSDQSYNSSQWWEFCPMSG